MAASPALSAVPVEGLTNFASLRAGKTGQSIVGRLIRVWDSRNVKKQGEFMGITILLLDELDSVSEVLHSGEGPIHSVKWRGSLIAWANDAGVKVYDTAKDQRVTFIERQSIEIPTEPVKQDNSVRTLSWSCMLSGFFVVIQSRKLVKKESVIIMPTFGIQLETQYLSEKTVSRFIPIGKILKHVLVECVTPVTCYWSLSLFLRGEEQLTLVFKELHPRCWTINKHKPPRSGGLDDP